MSNAKARKPAYRKVAARLTSAEELAAIKRTTAHLKSDSDALLDVMRRAGIVTTKGKLTKAFGG